ncbi:DUF1501 domain-containing protein [Psychroserpens sp.]|uniref:DUF1501 domain-containing protein n=1 Tax=Psychroserpens sp. TaxID=2020870 RepID=UPI001B1315B5|nr:DUF1501 domain-containing protein [Psychroserpens sp.]MBO6607686.1 DUF1501 domain-containing protein [Psychroserpens sp.]MBO6630103.1 DUF1501 domain-containing protein [Psychroserpens sp.]MBO6654677.1 DUF1501 domain-containing protein [Psychroserpens sp.]MBO6682899.1 DUF1501 domain-containing protein [Psychroserpens sp.]MBO6751044.1 DUF1501 domain-containing protein [Psychroserpens sp.]
MERRAFLKQSSLASSLLFVPSFIRAFDALPINKNGFKRLVIIQLSGGNDGLNTIVPYRNDLYYKSRPSIAIPQSEILKITDELGLHSSLGPLQKLYDQGFLSIINNVGYPNPNRSHFRAMDIWQTGSSAEQTLQTGWIGRYLDSNGIKPYNALEIDDSLSLALKGRTINGIAVKDPNVLFRTSQDPYFKNVLRHYHDEHLSEHNLGYLYKTMISAESSAKYIFEKHKTSSNASTFPKNEFARQMKTAARLINSGIDTKVFYASLDGFDTHANQKNSQSRLLKVYAESIEAFVMDLIKEGTFDDTLILTFSEFGRRVKQNAANGTDHGAASNVFIIGNQLKTPGIYNELASLSNLDENGDLKYTVDFRSIYATILDKWLDVSDTDVLNSNFEKLKFI